MLELAQQSNYKRTCTKDAISSWRKFDIRQTARDEVTVAVGGGHAGVGTAV